MSVKIYDASIGAFKDAPTPLIWDEQNQAYKDSVGLVWNESVQAWEERWSGEEEYIYNKGVINTRISGGLCEYYNVAKSGNSITYNSNYIEVKNYSTSYTSWAEYGVGTQLQVDVTNYSTIKAIVDDLRNELNYTARIGLLRTKQYFGGVYAPNLVCQGGSIGSIGDDHEIILDVSSMNGSYYLCVYSATSVYFRVKKLWLEK